MKFSHIVVGGGSAGCVVASRLSERADNSVLLIEAGRDTPPNDVPDDIRSPYAGRAAMNPEYFWSGLRAYLAATTNSGQAEFSFYEQARVMGGGSSVNGQVITRGDAGDYDYWKSLGVEGWGWNDVLPSFKRVERDLDFHNDWHGTAGPIPVHRVPREKWDPFTQSVAAALDRQGYRFVPDLNAELVEGYGPIPINTYDGTRVSSALGYLNREVRARKNLRIVARTTALRVLFDDRRAVGVEVNRAGRIERYYADEIILSCGAILTPTILMRSGIGPAALLTHLGIPVVVDRPGVGRNLQEHAAIHMSAYLKPSARITDPGQRHNTVYLRYDSGVSGVRPPDMLLNFASRSGWHAVGVRLATIQAYILQPFSRGFLKLTSADPSVPPEIRFELLADRRDMERMKDAFRRCVHLFRSREVSRVTSDPFATCYSDRVRRIGRVTRVNQVLTGVLGMLLDMPSPIRRLAISGLINDAPTIDKLMADDERLEDHIRRTVTGVWHPAGTCRMGPPDDPLAVTDSRARVIGVHGLRIADASIMPEIPRCNTNMPAMMIGEHVSGMILNRT